MDKLALIDSLSTKDRNLNRQSILDYEEMAKTLPQLEIPVKHYIHGGMYAREITIPKNTFLTGQIYKFDHFDVMISGDITVSTDDGTRKRIKGYNLFNGLSGKKRAGFAHEDTTWVTFHPFSGDDGEKIQKLLTVDNFSELDAFYGEFAKYDFYANFGNNLDLIEQQSKNSDDICDYSTPDLELKDSKIQGQGVFARKAFSKGDVLCKARIGADRTIYGAKINHNPISNAELNEKLEVVASRPIHNGDEITMNYKNVLTKRNEMGDLCQE